MKEKEGMPRTKRTALDFNKNQIAAAAEAMYRWWYEESSAEYDRTEEFVKENFRSMFMCGLKAAMSASKRKR